MKIIRITLILMGLLSATSLWAEMMSPNKKLKLEYVETTDSPVFVVSYMEQKGKTEVFTLSDFGILTQCNPNGAIDYANNELKLKHISRTKRVKAAYPMLVGKKSYCQNEGSECVYSFENAQGNVTNIVFRLYDDGLAFRYELKGLKGQEKTLMQDELTTFQVAPLTKRWMQKYNFPYEDFYPMNCDGRGESNTKHWAYPALFQVNTSLWMLISEAGINREHCASSLINDKEVDAYKVCLPQHDVAVHNSWMSPWRVVIIGSLADVVESTLITDVSEPSKQKDTKWIKPGVASWVYWAYNNGSNDYQIVKQYIDMAHELHLPYVLIDWKWEQMTNGGTIEEAVRYAQSLGVDPIVWYNSYTSWAGEGAPGPRFRLNTPESRNKEFAWLQDLGVKGVKIDFFSGDSLPTMNYYIDLLEDAAKHKLMVNFHGATIPRGWQRTYPNLMSVEAVYGAEWYNNAPVLTPKAAAHNATLPFTRNVIGPMDYTPCTFSDSQHPHITSHAHELALTVVFESAFQNLADRPSSYLSQSDTVKSFLSKLPSTWDETKLLGGYPGDYIVMARRKGDVWYVGGLNGSDENRSLIVDLSFLKADQYQFTLFEDGAKARSFNIKAGESATHLTKDVPCLPMGGFVLVLTPQKR